MKKTLKDLSKKVARGGYQGLLVSSFAVGILLLLASCGQGTDPLFALGDPSMPAGGGGMLFPFSYPSMTTWPLNSATNNEWTVGNVVFGTIARAPANGVIIASDALGITLLHSARVSTRIRGVTLSGVPLGTYVLQGTQIGTVTTNTNTASFSVIIDGQAVCPVSYLSSAARQQVNTATSLTLFCPI